MRGVVRPCLVAFGLLGCAGLLPAADNDERTLRDARVGTDGAALLQFFRNRTVGSADRARIAALVKQLGDDSFSEREKASAELVAIGARAESQLRDAVKNDPDAEVQRRAADCLQHLAKDTEPTLLAAAARVLAARKPSGAVGVLLDYLPNAPDESVADEVREALAALALTDGKADPDLVTALADKLALRRAAAATALCRAGARDQMPALRKLLRDADASVRLRVALALAFARDKEAVPALIALLAELPPAEAYEAEELLRALAGEAAPNVPLGKDDERKKARDAWAAWWKKNGDKVDMTRLAGGVGLGRTLIVQRDASKPSDGRVAEVGRDGKVLWQIEGLRTPVDAQVLPNGHVLVVEYTGRRLSERTTRGEVVSEMSLPATISLVIGAQRLSNGNTFVVGRTGLLEIDRDGKEVFSLRPGTIYAARKSRTGEVACILLDGTCLRLDANGKETARFPAGRVILHGGIDLLANGNVLVPVAAQNKVMEYDANGRQVWEANVQTPYSAVRLANGHTLVSSGLARVVELDRDGKEVWKCDSPGRPYKAYRR